jgi:hypothetical protein
VRPEEIGELVLPFADGLAAELAPQRLSALHIALGKTAGDGHAQQVIRARGRCGVIGMQQGRR